MEPTLQEAYVNYLNEEGFLKTHIDEEGKVIFKCEGQTYFILVDPERFSLVLPSFWELGDTEEAHRALIVCDEVNFKLHAVKVFRVHQDVSATVELFLPDPEEKIKDIFYPSVRALQRACYLFVSLMLKKQPPEPASGAGTPLLAHTTNGAESTPGYL